MYVCVCVCVFVCRCVWGGGGRGVWLVVVGELNLKHLFCRCFPLLD